ncbi:porphobilinogen deaminase [Roseburia sp. CAG:380]|nr:porphobilinogen deaminase [Roseburia sp. CAG:380]
MRTIRIGSRESRLAVVQSELVQKYLESQGVQAPIVTMKTTGDKILDRTLDQVGGKGLFVKELDAALLDGRSDISVHSLKDVPVEINSKLPLIGFSKREDPRDVLVLPMGKDTLDPKLPIGCSKAADRLFEPETCAAGEGAVSGHDVSECARQCADKASKAGSWGVQCVDPCGSRSEKTGAI